MNKGWECPRCGKIHAPYKMSCDCKPISVSAPTFNQCIHVWELSSGGITYCVKCQRTRQDNFNTYNYQGLK